MTSGKGKTMESVKKQWLPGVWGMEGREGALWGSETVLYDTVMMDT